MKKKLEAELISIAHRILQLKDKSTLPQLQNEAKQLYEKLTILNFAESYLSGPQPTIGQVTAALDVEIEQEKEEETPKEVIKPILHLSEKPEIEETPETIFNLDEKELTSVKVEEVEEENKPEIVIEKINAKVTEDLFVPAVNEESIVANITTNESIYEKNDKEDIGEAPKSIPAAETVNNLEEKPKSLNDQLKKGINIGLNDRLAFIKHLFEGSSTDYNRVLSQLNTLNSKGGAKQFIINMVKPDYNNWEGKEEYEERFIDIVLRKFEY
ncbi:hypothetical protein [Aquimarina sp. 2201CG5-10]|uniref:hypothetical protein n=1 Tax=Aquimarina callyspongiae TaxID=3098150 RepID=UPI002AB41AC2|nr:hypothetical protein [Aquimarina sp. 2201CG5-10]MDY8135167.1 hypothetical protein [Aquimarina sp. 2201CG5-10]